MPWPLQFTLTALIWGASFMFIKVQLDAGMAPLHVAFLRCLLGAATLLALVASMGGRLPLDRSVARHLVVVAALMNAVPFVLFAYAETAVASALAGLLNATTPLMTLLFALPMLPDERPTRRKVAGLLLGFAGTLVVLGPWKGLDGSSLLGALGCLGAAACYGLGFPYMRRHLTGRPESAAAISAVQVGVGALLLLPFVFLAPLPADMPGAVPWLSVFMLGVAGTGIAYVTNFNVLRAAGPQTASMVTYLVPVFAVVFGASLLGEEISWHEPAGGAVILAGVALGQGLLRWPAPSPRHVT